MKKELFKKWVKALRSGKYKQTAGALIEVDSEAELKDHGLCHEVNYCVVGVLADLALEKNIYGTDISFGDDGDKEKLSVFTLEKVGMSEGMQEKLIEMNDNKKMSFKRIAAFLEKNRAEFVSEKKQGRLTRTK